MDYTVHASVFLILCEEGAHMSAGDSPNPINTKTSGSALWRCFGCLRPYWRLTLGAFLSLLGSNAAALMTPQFIRWIVDRGIAKGDLRFLSLSIAGLLGLSLAKGGLTFVQGRWTEIAAQSVAYDLRSAIHRKLSDLSFSYHDRTETGQMLSRAIQDVDRIRFVTGRAFLRLADALMLLVGTLVALASMNVRLAVLALSMMPLLALAAYRMGRQLRPLSLSIQNQLAVLTSRVEQNLRGARIVKAFAQEDREIHRFEGQNRLWFDLAVRSVRLEAVNAPLLDLIANLGVVVVIGYGGLLVIRRQLTLGELVAFSTYVSQLVQPVRRLGMIIPAIAMAAAAGERVFEILDTVSEVQEAPDAVPLVTTEGRVCFDHVSFGYSHGHQVLNDISFEALPGQVVALLGATGSGKSTIINLIPRFYDATGGTITIDGRDLRRVTLGSLRDQIGIVLQETTLFATTIRRNIAFGRPEAGEAEIVAAARAAQAHGFISEMPQGYDTAVGERGLTLSGGQRQRIAIARALLKDPRILILDDATSSVDSETEQLIQQALELLMRGRTSFVIAQRLSTLRKADLILILEQGRIVASGTHAELLRTSGLYGDIYQRQVRPGAGNKQP
jgi:ATP-binding cassette, subfamily B, multidrug efflux pump